MSVELFDPGSRSLRLPVGLLLSIGDKRMSSSGKEYPVSIDHFRAKPGRAEQYEREVAAFSEVYGAEPRVLEDVHFLSNEVPAVFDVRLLAFSTTGFRGRSLQNFAMLEADAFLRKLHDPFTGQTFEFWPKDSSEVRPELRDSWEGEPISDVLTGPGDPRVEKLGIKLVGSLEFCLPRVMGLGKVAKISTSSRNSLRNLYAALWREWWAFGYRLAGIPFRLEVRDKPTQRWERKEKKYVSTVVKELVLDTSHTLEEIMQLTKARHAALSISPETRRAESELLTRALALPAPSEEDVATREEPLAEPESPGDALLNRIAHLELEVREGGSDPLVTLRGVFGVDDARELELESAERYAAILERALPAEEIDPADVEVIENPPEMKDSGPGGEGGGAAATPPPGGLELEPEPVEQPEPEPALELDYAALAKTKVPRSFVGSNERLGRAGQTLEQVQREAPEWLSWAVKSPQLVRWPEDFRAKLEQWMTRPS